MTDDQARSYVESGGVCCPYCGALDLHMTSSGLDFETGCITEKITCDVCNRTWGNVYALVGVAVADSDGEYCRTVRVDREAT